MQNLVHPAGSFDYDYDNDNEQEKAASFSAFQVPEDRIESVQKVIFFPGGSEAERNCPVWFTLHK
ncbi:MAG: hypothetical protein JXA03_09685 [Bacteroidales bacterium]|nr:hypothetical protein [Bacteroidales bacterium]